MNIRHICKNYLPVIVLGSATAFFLYDIISDVIKGDEGTLHLIIEGFIFFATTVILAYEVLRVIQLRKDLTKEQDKVLRLSGELSEVIQKDFEKWKLSESEKEVAILLIKGLSMNEIGELRSVKEKTVRQQATSIYSKSKCPNRHELAAKFIEDLLNV
ncbi:MAG: helix-turn-helix transcriptional regulator [Gammaproteobacteria bacterium]